ncbi:hypothetical protein Vadar_030401 [Vaccinium darrowii]|uniref:Uncharacterized protein n=1 Tax=Vaccinium darrowii TaxID=229202 RepID=A0ACB7ZNY7_9ERIC|nr:hypothetical protein Vadar_030401 [Vaccinium darrowii]
MWQLLVAAAVAGSGFFANRFLNPYSSESESNCSHNEDQQIFTTPSKTKPQPSTTLVDSDGSVFRFSSPGSRTGSGSKKLGKKKLGKGGNAEGVKSVGSEKKSERKCGGLDCNGRSVRKFAVCVKKRRTSKCATDKCESRSSKDNSVFSWGLGVGLMYMMSTGKAEIGRLNTAMDETAKVVQELKTELHKRKSSRGLQFSSSTTETPAKLDLVSGRNTNPVIQSSSENGDNVQDSGFLLTKGGGSASSVLTEEPQQEVVELDRLEAELESELQKLPWCSAEASGLDARTSDICETDASIEGFCKPDGQDSSSYHLSGVLPSELDQKLCHLLIEQQESQIVVLESELHQAQSKLNEKESELQALKDCVRRLTEFSLATVSDEETEVQVEEEKTEDGVYNKEMAPESQRSMVGMKRAMDFEPYSCHVK